MNSAEPGRFGGDCPPLLEDGVRIGDFTVLGRQPIATAANRRPVQLATAGRIGAESVIGCGCVIYAGVFIGRACNIGDKVVIREDTHIGDRCAIGTNADIQYGVTIGPDVRIMNGSHISGGTVIGEGSFIGPGVLTANDPHVAHYDLSDYRDRGRVAPIIGRHVFIGVGAIILPGVAIGDNSRIAAGALVTRDVPTYAEVFGIPARVRV